MAGESGATSSATAALSEYWQRQLGRMCRRPQGAGRRHPPSVMSWSASKGSQNPGFTARRHNSSGRPSRSRCWLAMRGSRPVRWGHRKGVGWGCCAGVQVAWPAPPGAEGSARSGGWGCRDRHRLLPSCCSRTPTSTNGTEVQRRWHAAQVLAVGANGGTDACRRHMASCTCEADTTGWHHAKPDSGGPTLPCPTTRCRGTQHQLTPGCLPPSIYTHLCMKGHAAARSALHWCQGSASAWRRSSSAGRGGRCRWPCIERPTDGGYAQRCNPCRCCSGLPAPGRLHLVRCRSMSGCAVLGPTLC